jgi:exonuclease III
VHKFFINPLFILINIIFACVLYWVSYTSIDEWWIEVLSFTIPFILGVTIFLIIISPFVQLKKWKYILVILNIILIFKPIQETYSFSFKSKAIDASKTFTVMSFNVAHFNPLRYTDNINDSINYKTFYTYLKKNESPDILCLQEFFQGYGDNYQNVIDSIITYGKYTNFIMNPQFDNLANGIIGCITFSKHKAIARGELDFRDDDYLNGNWNDFLIENDTIRVFNFQLFSMSIRLNKDNLNNLKGIKAETSKTYKKIKAGYSKRYDEVCNLQEKIYESPYKNIVCADLNALPYSSTYQNLKLIMQNSFEVAGSGFGFTYKNFPWFIRIDNQFCSPQIKVTHSQVVQQIEISDHYPILSQYQLNP